MIESTAGPVAGRLVQLVYFMLPAYAANMAEHVERRSAERHATLADARNRGWVDHQLGERARRGLEEVIEIVPGDLNRAVRDRDRVEEFELAHGPPANPPQAALIGMAVPFDSAVLGKVTVTTPFLKEAVTLLASTGAGS